MCKFPELVIRFSFVFLFICLFTLIQDIIAQPKFLRIFFRVFIFSFPKNFNFFTDILQNLATGKEQLHCRTNFLQSNYQCLILSFEVNVSDSRTIRTILFSCIPKKEVFFIYLVCLQLRAHKMILSKKLSASRKKQMCELRYLSICLGNQLVGNHFIRTLKAWLEGTYYVISDKLFINSFPIQLLVNWSIK